MPDSLPNVTDSNIIKPIQLHEILIQFLSTYYSRIIALFERVGILFLFKSYFWVCHTSVDNIKQNVLLQNCTNACGVGGCPECTQYLVGASAGTYRFNRVVYPA